MPDYEALPDYGALIQQALDKGNGGFSLDDIYQGIEEGHFHLWRGENSCVVGMMANYPQKSSITAFWQQVTYRKY